MAKLREQANQGLRKFVDEGVLMVRSAFQDERTITRQALSKAQQERRLFHVEVDGAKYFPSFFVDSRYDRAKLESVSKALGDLPGATKLHFSCTSEDHSLAQHRWRLLPVATIRRC